MRDLDDQIKVVQASTRTTFRVFSPVHNKLRMKSRPYYKWHLLRYAHLIHLIILGGTLTSAGVVVLNSYKSVLAASNTPPTSLQTAQATPVSSTTDPSAGTTALLQQLSKLATDETLKALSDKIAPISDLSSEQTQTDIKNKIETNLAKDETVLNLITTVTEGGSQQQAALTELSILLSKVSSEAALETLTTKIETGLAKDATLKEMQTVLNSGLSKDQTLQDIQAKIETGLAKDTTLQDIKLSLNSGLSKDQTLQDIKTKIESGLAKDATLQDIKTSLNSGLSKDQTLKDIQAKIESGLAKDATLQEIKATLNSGLSKDQTLKDIQTKIESGLAKDATLQTTAADLASHIDAVTARLNSALSVSISNWISTISVNNFPSTYPSSSVERAQETIGTDNFNKTEEFKSWALRKDYAKTAFSGEVTNPKTGAEIEALKLTAPAGHTYYVYKISYATTSVKNTNFKLYHKPSGGAEVYINKIVVPSLDSKTLDFEKKVKAGDDFRVTLEPVASATLTSSITISYYDLPWAE